MIRNRNSDRLNKNNRIFGKEDVQLTVEFNRIKRFELKAKDLRAGRVLNVRATTQLDNMLVEVFDLRGRPWVEVNKYKTPGLSTTRCLKYTHGPQRKFLDGKRDSIHVSTLVGYNRSFRYNTKTIVFFEKLKNASRFQQWCLLRNKPFTKDTYDDYIAMLDFEESFNAYMESADWES